MLRKLSEIPCPRYREKNDVRGVRPVSSFFLLPLDVNPPSSPSSTLVRHFLSTHALTSEYRLVGSALSLSVTLRLAWSPPPCVLTSHPPAMYILWSPSAAASWPSVPLKGARRHSTCICVALSSASANVTAIPARAASDSTCAGLIPVLRLARSHCITSTRSRRHRLYPCASAATMRSRSSDSVSPATRPWSARSVTRTDFVRAPGSEATSAFFSLSPSLSTAASTSLSTSLRSTVSTCTTVLPFSSDETPTVVRSDVLRGVNELLR
mmetsp:Transcript_23748/g.80898  ORF Transcript_23748/g.80898 Transcript_23748/m.80898 type:complete len:267 (+) Transcript_23748:692-1492(+)